MKIHNTSEIMLVDKWAGVPLEELLAERRALDAAIDAARADGRQAAIAQVRELVAIHGIRLESLMPFPRPSVSEARAQPLPAKKKAPAARYYDPNSGQTWTGRGKPPRWIAGKDYKQYLIPAEGILRELAQWQPAGD